MNAMTPIATRRLRATTNHLPLAMAGLLAACSGEGQMDRRSAETAPAPVAAPAPVVALAMLAPESEDRFTETEANPVKRVGEEPVSTFSADVDTASYAVVRRYLREGQLPPEGAVRVEEMINYFDYDVDGRATADSPFTARIAVMPTPWSVDTKLMSVSIKALDLDEGRRPPLNLVLLIDVSGSMSGADRLPLIKAGLSDFVRDLRPEDSIAIVTYAGGVDTVLEPTSGDRKERILSAIGELVAGGGTAGAAGMERAYALARENFERGSVNRVILATDGDFNIGASDPASLEDMVTAERKSGVYLSVLGVGMGNLNDRMMQRIAQAGNGNAYYVDTALEGRKVLRDEAASTLVPVADDVKFQVEFNPARVSEYRLIGYETRMLAREDFNDDRVDAGDVGSGQTVTAIYEITPAGHRPQVDPLRYGTKAAQPATAAPHGDELAFLRIRYKRPGAGESRLIERPVTDRDAVTRLGDATDDQRFAAAVAAYGQKLAGSSRLAGMSWDAIADLAGGARGRDVDGYRAEFVQLVRTADGLD